jgi:DNA-binding GntR family transcriptional regulator
VRTPNKNTTVTRQSPVDIAERVSIRIMLEPVVCWMAANRMTPADFADLQLHLKAISDAIQANLPFETAQADLAFHRRIWALSDCRFLYQLWTRRHSRCSPSSACCVAAVSRPWLRWFCRTRMRCGRPNRVWNFPDYTERR